MQLLQSGTGNGNGDSNNEGEGGGDGNSNGDANGEGGGGGKGGSNGDDDPDNRAGVNKSKNMIILFILLFVLSTHSFLQVSWSLPWQQYDKTLRCLAADTAGSLQLVVRWLLLSSRSKIQP